MGRVKPPPFVRDMPIRYLPSWPIKAGVVVAVSLLVVAACHA